MLKGSTMWNVQNANQTTQCLNEQNNNNKKEIKQYNNQKNLAKNIVEHV